MFVTSDATSSGRPSQCARMGSKSTSRMRLSTRPTLSASVAPLLGLLGTVAGIIHAFNAITANGLGDPRTLSGDRPKTFDRFPRRPCVPCEADQIVAPSPFTSATAHDGPSEAWLWNGQK